MMIWMIGIGGSLGAAARFLLGNLISRGTQKINPFPIGTWIINITGSFLLGVLTQFHLTNVISDWLMVFCWSWLLWCLYNFFYLWKRNHYPDASKQAKISSPLCCHLHYIWYYFSHDWILYFDLTIKCQAPSNFWMVPGTLFINIKQKAGNNSKQCNS